MFFRSKLHDLSTQLHGVVFQKASPFIIKNMRMSKQHDLYV